MSDQDSTSDDMDDYVLEQRLNGKSSRALAKELHCTVREIDQALDRSLPVIDLAARCRHIASDLLRVETLLKVFVKKAVEQQDVNSGLLCVKILERKAALLGLDQPTRLDVVQITATPMKQSVDLIREAIDRIANGTVNGAGEFTDEGKSEPAADECKPH